MADDPAQLSRLAIDAALNCQWEQALELNKQLLKIQPESIDCLNRMAKAYFELGKYSQAKKTYQETLTLDPYNIIAQKNLKRASAFKKDNGIAPSTPSTISPSLFLEEPGTTKTIGLVKVAEPQKLLVLSAGATVNLIVKNRGISVTDINHHYLGAMPDDIAHLLLRLIKGGNRYQAFIRSIKPNAVSILIREVFRSKKFRNQASFLDDNRILTFSSDHLTLITESSEESPEDLSEESTTQ